MFTYYQPTKIHFGEKKLNELKDIASPYGTSCFLVTTPDEPLQPLYERVKKLLLEKGINCIHFDQVKPNPSVELLEAGFEMMKQQPIDFVLAVGGGSSIDSAKVLAFTYGMDTIPWDELFSKFDSPYIAYPSFTDTKLPLLSIPTTSGTGSQVTQASVISRGDEKITFFHPDLFSKECILDPELMLTLPKRITASTGFDAFTHAFESYINPRASYYSRMDSIMAMRLIITYLPKVMQEPDNISYRSYMSLADTLAGKALANSGASAPHPLSEIIGGITHLPHGEALAIIFPSFVKRSEGMYDWQEVEALFQEIQDTNASLYESICDFLKDLELFKNLQDYKISEDDFHKIMQSEILKHLPFGSYEYLQQIIQDAYM